GVLVAPQPGHLEVAAPAVVAERHHLGLLPGLVAEAVLQHAAQHVMAVGEGIGLGRRGIADAARGGVPADDHLRRHRIDDRARARAARRRRAGLVGDAARAACRRGTRGTVLCHCAALRKTVESGGSASESECMRPWDGSGAASTPPRLPWPLPPYN